MGPRKIGELGTLVSLYDPHNEAMTRIANDLGANPALFRIVRVSDLDTVHSVTDFLVKFAIALPENTPEKHRAAPCCFLF